MLHLDFEFQLSQTRLAVIGWASVEKLASLYVQDGERILFPLFVSAHARRDLRSDELRGFVAVFETRSAIAIQKCSFHAEGEDSFFPLEGEQTQFGIFVHKAVDETFWDFCYRIGTGEIDLRGESFVNTIRQRILNATTNYGETPRMAAGLDRALVAQSRGVALTSGWIAADQVRSGNSQLLRAGFAICENALVPLNIFWDCHLRPDLSGFGDRFNLTGHEGFAGLLRTQIEDGAIETLVICAQYRRGQIALVRNVDESSASGVLTAVQQMDEQLNAPDFQQQTNIALRPRAETVKLRVKSDKKERRPKDGRITVFLDHDAKSHDLRDVLRMVRGVVGNDYTLVLMQHTIGRTTKRAIDADRNEAGDNAIPARCCPPETPIGNWPLDGTLALYATSSALMQFDLGGLMDDLAKSGKDGRAILFDPVLALLPDPSPARLAHRMAAAHLPFVALLDMTVLDRETQNYGGFATAEAQMRMLLLSLFESGRLDLERARLDQFFDGAAGRADGHHEAAKTAALLAGLDSEALAIAFAKVGQ